MRVDDDRVNVIKNTYLRILEYVDLSRTKLLTYGIMVSDELKYSLPPYKDKDTLGCVVYNLISCLKKNSVLVYSRNNNHNSEFNNITVYKIIKAVSFLEEEGYVINVIGKAHSDRDKRSLSFLVPTDKFIDKWGDMNLMIKAEIDYIEGVEVLELRDTDKNRIPFKMTRELKKMFNTVLKLNKMNDSFDVRNKEGYLLNNIYCRIFNEDFKHGGRFYRADVLGIPSKERLDITISNESVVEIDFSCLHFRIAGFLNGIDFFSLPEDVYNEVLGEDEEHTDTNRKVVKLAVNIMFNSKSYASAYRALSNDMKQLKKEEDFSLGSAKEVVEMVKNRYPEFDDIFCRGDSYGRVLQKHDSELAALILSKFVDRGIPCLPIHDSFIVRKSDRFFLEETMGESFREMFDTDLPVPVCVKYKDGEEIVKQSYFV